MPESVFCTWTWYTTAARDPADQWAAAGSCADLMVNLTVFGVPRQWANTLSVQEGISVWEVVSIRERGVPVQEVVPG